jgi:mRNA interferase MazF
MRSTTDYKQGDGVLVMFLFTDLTSTKRRPTVAISPDVFNRLKEDVVLVAVTSHITPERHVVKLTPRDVGSLPKDSLIKLTNLFTLHSSLVMKLTCRLRAEKKSELPKELRTFFG